jgi:hypothetical protein
MGDRTSRSLEFPGETRRLWDNWDIGNTDQSLNAFWSIVKLGHDETRQPPCSGNRNMTSENRQPIVKRISVIVKLAHTGIQKTPGPGDRSETQANRPMIVRCFFRIVRLVLGLPFFSILDNGKRRPNSPPRPARILAPSTDSGRPSPRPPLSVPVVKMRARRGPPRLRSGPASRRSATDSTPDALFHRSAPLSAPQVQTEARIFDPFGAQESIRTTSRKQVCERSASTCNSCPVTTPLGNSG